MISQNQSAHLITSEDTFSILTLDKIQFKLIGKNNHAPIDWGQVLEEANRVLDESNPTMNDMEPTVPKNLGFEPGTSNDI